MRIDLLAGTHAGVHPVNLVAPSRAPVILVFDSGLGGLTVHAEIARTRPDARFVYVADDEAFPYGRLSEAELLARVLTVMAELITAHAPDIVVIACNTASTVVLPALRARFAVPFVGTVPAIKPAAERTRTGLVSVLATPGTVARDYTHDLVRAYAARCRVTLVGSTRLAALAEAEMAGEPAPDEDIRAELEPCFVAQGQARTDVVVLGCTHYPLLAPRLTALAPWPVEWLDPAPAIARRVTALIGPAPANAPAAPPGLARFTSGARPREAVAAALTRRGLTVAGAVGN